MNNNGLEMILYILTVSLGSGFTSLIRTSVPQGFSRIHHLEGEEPK